MKSRRRSDSSFLNPFSRFKRRYTLEQPSVLVAFINRELRIVSHSSTWREWLGDAPLDGRDVREAFGSEPCDHFRRAFNHALDGRPARAGAWVSLPPLGPRTIEVSCIPQTSETGEIRGFFAVVTEIPSLKQYGETELERTKREEKALHETRDRLRLAVETAEMGTWDWDLRSGLCFWNARLGKLWGLPPAAQGDRGIFLANLHPDDRGRVEQVLQEAIHTGHEGVVHVEFRTVSPSDGTERWLSAHVRVLLDASGEPLRLIGTAVDVTRRKSMELELEFRKTLLESENEAAIDGILVVDKQGRMVSFNHRFVQMWNIPPQVVASRSDDAAIASILHTLVSPDEFLSQVRHLYAHPDDVSRDELRLQDGRTFDRFSAPIRTALGVYYGRVWFFRDVTEQKRNEEALREGTARLKEALLELNTFAYSVAHDLRAPLRAIAGFSEILREDLAGELSLTAGDYFARIAESAKRMDLLIMDLLTYSSLTREPMSIENVDLGALVSNVLARFEPEVRQRQGRVDLVGLIPGVLAHRDSLDQVISNLLSNALKFVNPGTPPRIRIFVQPIRDRIRLWMEDNGIGIDPAHLDRIFGVFQRLHSLSNYSGTGIGLAIVKRAVEKMGGCVGVESELGKGSRFWIELKPALPEKIA